MTIQELNSMISDFVQVGFMEAVKAYEPASDLIKLKEVKKWLKMMYFDYKKFDALVEKDIIKPVRKGSCKNSPLYYSKKEIKQAFAMANVCKIITMNSI